MHAACGGHVIAVIYVLAGRYMAVSRVRCVVRSSASVSVSVLVGVDGHLHAASRGFESELELGDGVDDEAEVNLGVADGRHDQGRQVDLHDDVRRVPADDEHVAAQAQFGRLLGRCAEQRAEARVVRRIRHRVRGGWGGEERERMGEGKWGVVGAWAVGEVAVLEWGVGRTDGDL